MVVSLEKTKQLMIGSVKNRKLKEAVKLSGKLRLFNSKFYQEFDDVNIFCQKLTLLA